MPAAGPFKCGLSRFNYQWQPDPEDDHDYVWRNGYWELLDDDYRDQHSADDEEPIGFTRTGKNHHG